MARFAITGQGFCHPTSPVKELPETPAVCQHRALHGIETKLKSLISARKRCYSTEFAVLDHRSQLRKVSLNASLINFAFCYVSIPHMTV